METEILSETSGKRMKQFGNIWKHDEQKICINQHGNRMISLEAYGTYEWEQMEQNGSIRNNGNKEQHVAS